MSLAARPVAAATETADLVLRHAKIWTGDPEHPSAEALAIRDERIVAVGTDAEVASLVATTTRVIDAKGRRVVPGFIDDHTHFMDGGFEILGADLRMAASPAEFARRLGDFVKRVPAGRWITNVTWDHERWPGSPLPTRELVDPVTGDHPIFIQRLDGHMGVANSRGLALAKITRETKDPDGGTIVRDAKGEPTGVLKDAAMGLIFRAIPDPGLEELRESLVAAMKRAAEVGVTSIQDITLWDHWNAYRRAREKGELTVRIYARTPLSSWERQRDWVRDHGAGDAWLRLGGFKAFADGALGSRTALFFEPYLDDPKTSGLLGDDWFPEGALRRRVAAADRAGFQVSIHAIGEKANALVLDLYESVAKENGPRDRRFRIEHAQHLRKADIARFAALGVVPSMQPFHLADDGRWADNRIGFARSKDAYVFRSLLDSGARLAFGTDWPVATLDPLQGIAAAVTRRTLDGKQPGGWHPEEKITLEEAVRAYTATPAYAEFAENEKGMLAVGKLGDFVVLSDDLFAIPPERIDRTQVAVTVVGGRVVYESATAGGAAHHP